MKVLALDVWQDLRAKRLWPVAVVLVAGILGAVIFTMSSGSDAPPPTPPAASTTGSAAGPDVTLTEEPLGGSSDLDRFGEHDPFAGVPHAGDAEAGGSSDAPGMEPWPADDAAAPSPPPDTPSASTSAAPPSSSSPSSSPVSTPAASSSSASSSEPSGASSPPSSSGGSGGQEPAPSQPPRDENDEPDRTRVEVRYFTPTVDVMFGPVGSAVEHKGLRPSDGLPKRRPRVLFAGVNSENEAVFSLAMGGATFKGGCSDAGCPLVISLREGAWERINTPGDDFMLRVTAVHAQPPAR